MNAIEDTPKGVEEALKLYADNSPYTLEEWIEALKKVNAWLIAHERTAPFSHIVAYLECCAASTEARDSAASLSTILEGMLKVHGLDPL